MNEITKVFNNRPVRIIENSGETYFVGRDVCKLLGYKNEADAMKRYCRGVVKRYPILDRFNRHQNVRIITEPDVMRLICGSKLPSAVQFERWVFEDVLPQIRKTGMYFQPQTNIQQMQTLIESLQEQYKLLIETNTIMRQQLEYAQQFTPLNKYGTPSKCNGKRRLGIRRGSNVAGGGRPIERRDPEEIGYQVDLFDTYLPQLIFTQAVTFLKENQKD